MAWSVIAGCLESETDEALMDLARHRFHVAEGRSPEPYEPLPRRRDHVGLGFVAHRRPWRLAVVRLGDQEVAWPEVAGWGGQGWASVGGDPVTITGDTGAPEVWQRTHGDLGLRAMLDVDWLRALTGGALGRRLDVPPRRMLELTAMEDWPYSIGLIALGADRQSFTYDPDADVLTSMEVHVDGHVAWSLRLAPLCSL